MPWTKSDVSKFKSNLTEEEKGKWISIANSVLKQCMDKGGDDCEAKAIRIANSRVGQDNNEDMNVYVELVNNYKVQKKEHQGKMHLVVPVVMMTEGVRNGSRGPLFHSAEELGKIPAAWNGIPIVINHPKDENGNDIPANSPDIIDQEMVGRVYNTHMNGEKLSAEAWLDEKRLQQVSPMAFQHVESQKPLEVSVGVFNDMEKQTGYWNNKQYEAIARNHRPDHLALLPGDKVGACSIEDGCGLGVNEFKKKGGEDVMDFNYQLVVNELSYSGTESTDWSAPDLSAFGVKSWEDASKSEKAKVAGHFLIGSSGGETFGDLHYPVVNPKTGKLNENALRAVISGRGAALKGVASDTKSAARRRAYRLLNSKFDADLDIPDNLEENFYRYESKPRTRNNNNKREGGQIMTKEQKVESLVNNENNKFTKDDKEWLNSLEDAQLDKLTPEEGPKPCCPDKVDALIANEKSNFTKEDKEWLLKLDEKTIDKLTPQEAQKPDDPNNNTGGDDDKDQKVTKDDIKSIFSQYEKPEEFIKEFYPEELQDEAITGLRLYREKRQSMIEEISNHTQSFSKEELQKWNNDQLEKLHGAVVPKTDYTAFGSGFNLNKDQNEGGSLPTMEVLEAQARAQEKENKK